MNLSTIIEMKKEEFDKEFPIYHDEDCGFSCVCEAEEQHKKMMELFEKAIRESVEEALREVIPDRKTAKKENGKISLRAEENRNGYNQCRFEMYVRVKEFMK